MRRRSVLPTLLVAAAAWLAAGPGGVTLQAIAACWHHPEAHGGHHEREAPPLPPGTPCFCDQMTGGSDVLVTPAVPAPAVVSGILALAVRALPFPLLPAPAPPRPAS